MTGAERGFLLLCCHLGNPERKPLTVAQFRKLARRVRDSEKSPGDRELELSDLTKLGYSPEEGGKARLCAPDPADSGISPADPECPG